MKSVPIVLLLAVMAACQEGAEAPADLAQPDLTPLTLPVASQGVADKGCDPHDRLVINVGAKGFVYWKGKKITLDELGAILGNRKEVYDLKMRAKGKRGLEDLPGGGKASKLFVLLRVDKEIPWQHVQWILTILAEQKFYKVQFAVRRVADSTYTKDEAARLGAEWVDRAPSAKPELDAKLKAFLPTDKGLLGGWKQPQEVKISIHIVARKEIAARWGPKDQPVSKPTVFKYRLGDGMFDTLEHVRKWIGEAQRAAQGHSKVVGEIKAGHKVPFKHVVAALNQFHARGVMEVEFYGTSIPGKELRKHPYLPYPLKNYPTK